MICVLIETMLYADWCACNVPFSFYVCVYYICMYLSSLCYMFKIVLSESSDMYE